MKNAIHKCFTCLMMLSIMLLEISVATAASDGMIRVRLTRLGTCSTLHMILDCAYAVNGKDNAVLPNGSELTISLENDSLVLSSGGITKNMGTSFTLARGSSGSVGARFTLPRMDNVFAGDFWFEARSGQIVVTLKIYIEEYLLGVVPYEMSDSAPIEALKAQAILARTYALRQKSVRGSMEYDVTDNTSNQVFKGYNASNSRAREAVEATKGMVGWYGNALAECYYGDSNGGQTESTANIWGEELPYSVVKDDPYDLESDGTCKSAFIPANARGLDGNLLAEIKECADSQLDMQGVYVDADGISIRTIKDIVPRSPFFDEPSHVYQVLRFFVEVSANGKVYETYADVSTYGGIEDWYNLSINSGSNETVSVDEAEDGFYIRFRRSGHGVGMSQCGAVVMAQKYGMSYSDILAFYFPGVTGKILSLSDTTGHYSVSEYTPAPTQTALWKIIETPTVTATLAPTATPAATAQWHVVTPTSAPTAIPTATTVPQSVNDGLTELPSAQECRVSVSVPMYAEANVNAKTVAALSEGDTVTAYAQSEAWVRVMTKDGKKGYAQRRYILTLADGELCGMVKRASGLYTAAYNTNKVRESVSSGSYVRVLAYGTDTAYCQSRSGKKGYMPLADLKKVSAQEANDLAIHEANFIVRLNASVYMYTSDDTSSAKQGIVPWGEEIRVLAYNSIWAYAQYGEDKGFIYRHSLERVS